MFVSHQNSKAPETMNSGLVAPLQTQVMHVSKTQNVTY